MSIKEITVVFIGQLSMSPSKLQDEAIEYGLTVKSTINAQTNFLVTNLQISEVFNVESPSAEITISEEYRRFPYSMDQVT